MKWLERCEAILNRYKTSGLFQVDIQTKRVKKIQKRYRNRKAKIVEEVSFDLSFKIDESAVKQQIQLLGWRVYVTNKNQTEFSLKQAVRAYRSHLISFW